MDDRVGFELEALPRRSTWRWKLPALAFLLLVFAIVYWKLQPTREFSGQYVGHLDTIPVVLSLGQSGTRLFGQGELRQTPRTVNLTGTITNGSHFELHGTSDSPNYTETIFFEGECTTNIDNNKPQVSGLCQLGDQDKPTRFVGRYLSPWCPPSALRAEKLVIPSHPKK